MYTHRKAPMQGGIVQFAILALFVLLALVHFSLPAIVTFDSAHYHLFVPILEGAIPFSEWDIIRGPVFPFLLLLSKKLFGFASHGFITCTALFYVMTAWTALRLLSHNIPVFKLSCVCALLGTLFLALDPLVLGYYHTMLTEFVAATIFMISVLLALEWVRLDARALRGKSWQITGWFMVSLPISYLLKQPYVTTAALPLLGAFLVSLIRLPRTSELVMRAATVGISLLSLYVSIVLWEDFLPAQSKQKYVGRSSAAMLSNQIVQGLRSLEPVPTSGQNATADVSTLPNLPTKVADEFKTASTPGSCTQLFKARNDSGYIVYNCATGSVVEGLRFVLKNLISFPVITLRGYARSYLEIARAKDIRLFGFREHEPIAFRLFVVGSKISNVFPIPNPHLERLVRGYRIDEESVPGGIVGRLSHRWFRGLSLWLFTWTIVLAPSLFLLTILCLLITRATSYSFLGARNELLHAICVINFCITLHVGIHAFLMAIIDRYAFPVYPLALVNVFLILSWLLSAGISLTRERSRR